MTATKAQMAATRRWRAKALDRLEVQTRKELEIPERIAAAVEAGRASSRQEYITKAILSALERDGIMIRNGESQKGED